MPSGQAFPEIPGAALPVTLAVVGGMALGLFHPLLDLGRTGDNAVAPYGLTLLFAVSILVSTVLLAPFFFNFPVAGAPIRFGDYFSGTPKQHALGLLGGILAGAAFPDGHAGAGEPLLTAVGLSYGLSESGPVLGVTVGC